MDPRAQRLLDLRAELKTIDDLLDIIDDKAERRQYLCDKLATQREVTLIQRGDEASGSTQVKRATLCISQYLLMPISAKCA